MSLSQKYIIFIQKNFKKIFDFFTLIKKFIKIYHSFKYSKKSFFYSPYVINKNLFCLF
jgi:hypothetical protein